MNVKTAAVTVGAIIAFLGIAGLISGETRLFDAMNVNLLLDVARIALGAILIVGGLKSSEAAKGAFSIFGFAYLGMFALGLASPTLFGMLSNELGWMDQTLHLGGGVLGLIAAFTSAPAHSSRHATA